jgi:hypothetical protein
MPISLKKIYRMEITMKTIYTAAFVSAALFAASDVGAAGRGCYLGEGPGVCAARNRGEVPLAIKRPRDGETAVLMRPKRVNPEEGSGSSGRFEKPRRNPEEGSGSSGIFGKKRPRDH